MRKVQAASGAVYSGHAGHKMIMITMVVMSADTTVCPWPCPLLWCRIWLHTQRLT